MSVPFLTRIIRLFTIPESEWQLVKGENPSAGELFQGYGIPLALIPFIASLPSVISQTGYLGIPLNLFFLAISILFMHITTVIIEILGKSLGSPCSRETAMKLSYYSLTPIFVFLALVPLIGGYFLLCFPSSLILFSIGTNVLMDFQTGKKLRFILATILLSLAALLLINLFIIGMMGMIFGI